MTVGGELNGIVPIAEMCEQAVALPAIGGEYDCYNAVHRIGTIHINAYPNLQQRPEFENFAQENKTITPDDIIALYINVTQQGLGDSRFLIENSTDINELAKIVHLTFDGQNEQAGLFDYPTIRQGITFLSALSEDKNTGYSVAVPILYNYTSLGFGGNGEKIEEYADMMNQVLSSFQVMP